MRKLTVLACLSLLFCLIAASVPAAVFHNRRQAIKIAFPDADKVQTRTVFIAPEEIQRIQKLAHAPMESRLLTFYAGYKADKLLGYAFIDSHVVRTQPETFLALISPDGTVKIVRILAFHEPSEYMPPLLWIKQFLGKKLSGDLRLKRDIQGITGATMSARALTSGVRKALAIHRVLLGGKD